MEEPLERDRAGGNATPPSQNEIPSCAEIKMKRGCTRDSIVGHYQQFQHKLWRVGQLRGEAFIPPAWGEQRKSGTNHAIHAIVHGHHPRPSEARPSTA